MSTRHDAGLHKSNRWDYELHLSCPLRVYLRQMVAGISRSREFERKMLGSFAVAMGVKCGHCCLYCSTGATLRTHPFFSEGRESPFDIGYAIVDPKTVPRVARDAARKRRRGMVVISHITDAYSPEAQRYNLGRGCLEAVLSQPDWEVRVLTKNQAVVKDFDIIEQYRDRVLVGLSITATPDKSELMRVIEPNASSIPERMAVLREASRRGLRTFGMFCPLLPGISDGRDEIDELVSFAAEIEAEEIFVEPLNPRGPNLQLTQEALQAHGYDAEAAAIRKIRKARQWSAYATELVSTTQLCVRKSYDIRRLRFLLYPSRLFPQHAQHIRENSEGIIWLTKE